MLVKPFMEQGRYTQFHNVVLDQLMPNLSPTAWKVLCLIIRKTKGWRKEEDTLSYSQIIEGTGIKSTATVSKAIKELLERNCIAVSRSSDKWEATSYSLNLDFEIEVPTLKNEVEPTLKIKVDTALENEVEPTLKNEDTKETIKENKRKQKAAAASRDKVAALIGGINTVLAGKVDDLIEDYTAEWVGMACEEAAEHNGRSLAYVRKVLERWRQDGGPSKKNGNGGGYLSNGNIQKIIPPANIIPPELQEKFNRKMARADKIGG